MIVVAPLILVVAVVDGLEHVAMRVGVEVARPGWPSNHLPGRVLDMRVLLVSRWPIKLVLIRIGGVVLGVAVASSRLVVLIVLLVVEIWLVVRLLARFPLVATEGLWRGATRVTAIALLPVWGALCPVVGAAALLLSVEVLDGAERDQVHLLEVGVIEVSLSHDWLLKILLKLIPIIKIARPITLLLTGSSDFIKLLKLRLQLQISSLQILNELVLRLHHFYLFVQISFQFNLSLGLRTDRSLRIFSSDR
jgi:hypothetical protein